MDFYITKGKINKKFQSPRASTTGKRNRKRWRKKRRENRLGKTNQRLYFPLLLILHTRLLFSFFLPFVKPSGQRITNKRNRNTQDAFPLCLSVFVSFSRLVLFHFAMLGSFLPTSYFLLSFIISYPSFLHPLSMSFCFIFLLIGLFIGLSSLFLS